jgi:RNA polymerase sporulation-specific sigma factor
MEKMKTEEKNKFDRNADLIRAYRDGDGDAGEELCRLNRPLVISIANRFLGRGVDFDELCELANIGLVKAINSFDFDRGCVFSTYAVPLIFGEIRRFLRDDGIIKVSREEKKLSALLNAERERRLSRGEDTAIGTIARAVGVSVQDASVALFSAAPVRSLSESAYDDDDSTSLADLVFDENEEKRSFEWLALKIAIEKLSDDDRRLITLRYFRDFSQVETARVMGLSQVKVSRMEKKILARLRKDLE